MKSNNNKMWVVKASGHCMEPAIIEGDILVVKSIMAKSEIMVNDIIICKIPEGFGCHRLIKIETMGNEDFYITKGDTRLYCDAPIKYDDIVGKVITIIGKNH